MTRKLYLGDPYRTTFEGRIVRRVETPDGPAVVLEETYFYPESGGQPHDLGTFDGISVRRIEEQGDDVLHILTEMPDRDRVVCVVDGKRRRDHMQQHSGQHILSAAFLQVAGAPTLSFHLGSTTSTIDLDASVLAEEVLQAAEHQANLAVRNATAIRSYFVQPEEAARLELRKTPDVEGTLRVVEVEGVDRQACCGTHPRNAAEVGPILIRGAERLKNGTRVEFVCGDRALGDYHVSIQRLRALSRALSASPEALVQAATHLVEEKTSLRKSLLSLREEIIQHRARQLAEGAVRSSVIVQQVADVTPGELRQLGIYLTQEPGRVACLGCTADQRAHLVFARSADVTRDMADLLRHSLGAVDGQGGGSVHIAQGGGPRVEGLPEALQLARRVLEEKL